MPRSCNRNTKRNRQRGGGHVGTIRGRHCAPSRGGKPYSCYSVNELQAFAKQLDVMPHDSADRRDKEVLWNAVDGKMASKCTTEYCWGKHIGPGKRGRGGGAMAWLGGGGAGEDDYGHAEPTAAFRPRMPTEWEAKPNLWLSTVDIQQVMNQYEAVHSDFKFIGPVPVDFQSPSGDTCVSPELCQIDLHGWWKQGIRRVGIVFNMDPHDMSGSHWVAAFCDMAGAAAYYYDSFGVKAPQEIDTLLRQFAAQGQELLGTPLRIESNETRHQFKNTECGVYSMHFIMSMLSGQAFDEFIANGMNDEQMQRFRQYFYHRFD